MWNWTKRPTATADAPPDPMFTRMYKTRSAIVGGLPAQHLIQVTGTREKIAEFEEGHPGRPRPYDGPVAPDDDVFHLDVGGEPMNFNPAPKPPLDRSQVRRRYRYGDTDLNYAMSLKLLALPAVQLSRADEMAGGRVNTADVPEYWAWSSIEAFDEHLRRLVPGWRPND
jgi:hypothetical protein